MIALLCFVLNVSVSPSSRRVDLKPKMLRSGTKTLYLSYLSDRMLVVERRGRTVVPRMAATYRPHVRDRFVHRVRGAILLFMGYAY
jgi:hypothetical protein